MRFLVGAIIGLLALAAFSNARLFRATLKEPSIYRKDFLNHYVVGRATLVGVNPYAEIGDLAKTLIGPQVTGVFPHPSPYPPPNVLLLAPFGALRYKVAVVAWHVLQFASLLFVALLLLSEFKFRRKLLKILAVGALAFAWDAVAEDFFWGNSMLVLLAPLTLAWVCLRREKDGAGGALLGIVIALKVIAWPLLLLLAFRKNLKAVVAAGVVIIVANIASVLAIGFDPAVYYYSTVPGIVAPLYRARRDNFSIFGIAWRLFEGTGSPIFDTLRVAPLFYAPQIASVAAIVLPLLALSVALYFTLQTRSFDLQFALMLCACVVLGPLAWKAYLVWLALPLAVLIWQLRTASRRLRWLALLVAVLLFGYPTPLSLLAAPFMKKDESVAPFAVSLVTFIPLLAVMGLFGLLFLTRVQTESATYLSERTVRSESAGTG